MCCFYFLIFFFKQKTAYEMRISDWSSDGCSSDLAPAFDVNRNGFQLLFDHFQRIGAGDETQWWLGLGGDLDQCPAEFVWVADLSVVAGQIGRASCRARVCKYV